MKKILLSLLITAAGVMFWYALSNQQAFTVAADTPPSVEQLTTRTEKIEITDGSTFSTLMTQAGVSPALTAEIFEVAQETYDLSKIRLGRTVDLIYDINTNQLKELIYQIDSEEELHVALTTKKIAGVDTENATSTEPSTTTEWEATIVSIEYQIEITTASGTIETSMYEAALKQEIDERAIIELATVFQWSVDFAMDPRVGDTFAFVYEKRFRNGQYVMPGKILAGRYVNDGTPYDAFYFAESSDNTGYFDHDGNSVQKIFLKAPVEYRYISSGFTTGPRYVAQFQTYTSSHQAIDYAAAAGTPIRSVGAGTVVSAGWNSQGYGYLTTIRHNATYSTRYAHQSRIIIKAGQKVEQGQIIGYVGSTGFSTGPHLHYEMIKNGVKVNPLREVLPPGKAIAEENLSRFQEVIAPYLEQLGTTLE